MPHLITGLKYDAPNKRCETESQALDMFADLKNEYLTLNESFEITTPNGRPLNDFEDFLGQAVQRSENTVVLDGSGDIGGLIVRDGRLEYDLSPAAQSVKYWDQNRDGSCHSCLSLCRDHNRDEWVCGKDIKPMQWKNCADYDARIVNKEGGPARPLQELIAEAIK